MAGADFIGIVGSPAGVMLAGQVATLLFVIAGLLFMIGWRHVAKRLMIVAVVVVIVPFVIAANHDEIIRLLDGTPRWVLAPTLAAGAVIVFCWGLWGIIALCFGTTIATTVTADIMAWLIKGLVLAVLAPYRGLSGLLRRLAPRDSTD